MKIEFIEPLSKAFSLMKSALFRPFDLKKWFVLGFSAFLAQLGEENGSSGGNSSPWKNRGDDFSLENIANFPQIILDWIYGHPGMVVLAVFILVFIIIFSLVLLWLTSRGKFVFLYNVAYNKSEIKTPWAAYQKSANGLFIWRLGYSIICFLLFLLFAIPAFMLFQDIYWNGFSSQHLIHITGLSLFAIIAMIIPGFIGLLLENFIVPIMFKFQITTNDAWKKLFSVFSKHAISFIIYIVMVFFLKLFIFTGVLFIGIFTCCIGFLLLAIPYISSVVLLPISYLFRTYSLTFLEQTGSEFEILKVE